MTLSRSSESTWTWVGGLARGIALLLLSYWALFALLAPVTVWDAHTYNLGRLPIAEAGGIFDNPLWTTERQLVFPLTYDALHLPFVHLGWGYGLPSYLCLIGLGSILWTWLNKWRGREVAWLGWMVLLGMPTLMFQAVIPKNDIPVVFGLAAWGHAMLRWREDHREMHLYLAAAALGFASGAKSIGVALSLLAGLWTLYLIGKQRPAVVKFIGASVIALLLLGSVETYVATAARYGHPFGPEGFRADHQNNDGVRGAIANSIRYAAGNLATGSEPFLIDDPLSHKLAYWTGRGLHSIGLPDKGYRPGYNDQNFPLLRNGWDSSSDYGPLGTLALVFAAVAIFYWRPQSLWWRFALVGIICWSVVCLTVAWMPWNSRFLMAPFCAWTIGLLLALRPRSARIAYLFVAIYGAIVYPLRSFNKQPGDLAASIVNRQQQELRERSGLIAIVQELARWRKDHPQGKVLLVAGNDSWVLPFLTNKQVPTQLTPLNRISEALETKRRNHEPTAVLVLNRPDFQRDRLPLTRIANFPTESDSALFALRDANATAKVYWTSGSFADGWTAPRAVLAVEGWDGGGTIEVELWNPTPLSRQVSISSSTAPKAPPIELAAGERRQVAIHVVADDSASFAITPPFSPGQGETRILGLHIRLLSP